MQHGQFTREPCSSLLSVSSSNKQPNASLINNLMLCLIKREPCLCLNDRSCSIGGVEVTIQGESRITWVANKLVSVLKNPLRDYVVSVIINALKNNSGWLIEKLNQNLGNYWDFILKTAKLELEKLPKLARHHVTEAESDPGKDTSLPRNSFPVQLC